MDYYCEIKNKYKNFIISFILAIILMSTFIASLESNKDKIIINSNGNKITIKEKAKRTMVETPNVNPTPTILID